MKVTIDTPNKTYDILIDKLPDIDLDTKVAIITNPTVAGYHLNYLLNHLKTKELIIITLPDGEEYKNYESIEYALDRLFDAKYDRNSVIIAFGGGVIGDMSGFCASIFLRGIKFIQIPTTLLAMVDSSVGGKTGINNKYGKNLIGSFYQPEAVYIDTHFLSTLPKREFAAGMAEVIKMAVMFDKEFFEKLEKEALSIEEIIKRSVEIKANVVNQDEKERGIRSVLNYGHTFGHVIENLTNYKTYLHGEAVAIGMIMANELSIALGYLTREENERIKKLLKKYDLPTSFKIKDEEEFYEHFFADKKTMNNKIKFIIPEHIGKYKIVQNLNKEILLEVLRKFK
ncbi:3-dehydroquinate synthase [Lebetimonas natsushimae]|uniref:3-dehydroquinate synthase n=1 Tax=Lebetimonas natsushimae TaxID=1936991 RepID=A0A292YCP5_9BACT|nr:3-dehydroquinate synthase [Lebetimonas natsushimae]GAX87213.1 3-dehydroquinate synthase [Lebetimonas natsushimae]